MTKQAVIAAAAIERMMDAFQCQCGNRIVHHTIRDIGFRAKISTPAAKDGIAILMDHGTVSSRVNGGLIEYRLHSDVRFGMEVQRMLRPAYA